MTDDVLDRAARIAKLFGGHDSFDCPFCGYTHALDGETCSAVVSYWGDDVHDFSCYQCGKDFKVRENVTRQFETFVDGEDDY